MHGHGEYIWSDGLKYQVCKKLTQVTKLCFIFMYIFNKSHNMFFYFHFLEFRQ